MDYKTIWQLKDISCYMEVINQVSSWAFLKIAQQKGKSIMNNKIMYLLFPLLMLFNISATPMTPLASLSNQTLSDIQIERLSDGTSTITFDSKQEYGFSFTTPNGWYPMALPSSSEEFDKFKSVAEENDLPPFREVSSDDSNFKMVIFDLNPEHYQNNHNAAIFVGNFTTPESTPNWPIIAMLKGFEYEYPDQVTEVDIKKINSQIIGIVEFTIPLDESESLTGKMLVFVRSGKMFVFVGATDNNEWLSDVSDVIDSILATLDFDVEQ